MYSNNILSFQESTTILDAHTKKVRKLIVCTSNKEIDLATFGDEGEENELKLY